MFPHTEKHFEGQVDKIDIIQQIQSYRGLHLDIHTTQSTWLEGTE